MECKDAPAAAHRHLFPCNGHVIMGAQIHQIQTARRRFALAFKRMLLYQHGLYYFTIRFLDKALQHRMSHCTAVRQAGQQASFDPTVLGTFSDQRKSPKNHCRFPHFLHQVTRRQQLSCAVRSIESRFLKVIRCIHSEKWEVTDVTMCTVKSSVKHPKDGRIQYNFSVQYEKQLIVKLGMVGMNEDSNMKYLHVVPHEAVAKVSTIGHL